MDKMFYTFGELYYGQQFQRRFYYGPEEKVVTGFQEYIIQDANQTYSSFFIYLSVYFKKYVHKNMTNSESFITV